MTGHQDGYYGNTLYQAKDGNYGNPAGCATYGQGPDATVVHSNTVYTPTGAVTECGVSLAVYQNKGGDVGTVAAAYPDDAVIIAAAKALMGL